VAGKRLVQSWRPGNWDEGIHSLVRIELEADETGTKLSLFHDACPEGTVEHLEQGWHDRYWTPLAAWLAKG
jgi:activator of HSP90 ATPase